MRKIVDEVISEEDLHHLHIKSTTERQIYNLRPRKPRKHPGVDDYAYAQIVHYVMTKNSLSKELNKFHKVERYK